MHRVTAGVIAAVVCGGLVLAGCSSASSTSAGSSAAAGADNAVAMPPAAAPSAGAAQTAGANLAPMAGAGADHAPAGKSAATTARIVSTDIVYTAELGVRAADVNSAAAQAVQIAQASGGYVSSETTSSGAGAIADITLKIPAAIYPATLARLAAGLGTQLSLNQQAQDVTEQVADVNSQVTSDEAAIAQLRALLSHAGSVGDLLTVQNQINSEESDLEQVESQQRTLGHETAYATVIMTIQGPAAKPAVSQPAKPKPPPGLTRGLGAGWHALKVTTTWVLAILGAFAPFGAIAAVVAIAFLWARRWTRRRRTVTE